MRPFLRKTLILLAILALCTAGSLQAQTPEATGANRPPVMQSIFWNTLWGSGWGAVMGGSYHLASGINIRESVVTGATVGGMLGYGLGIYLVLNGISFDQRFLIKFPTPKFGPPPQASTSSPAMLPDALYTRRSAPAKDGWSTLLFDLRF